MKLKHRGHRAEGQELGGGQHGGTERGGSVGVRRTTPVTSCKDNSTQIKVEARTTFKCFVLIIRKRGRTETHVIANHCNPRRTTTGKGRRKGTSVR